MSDTLALMAKRRSIAPQFMTGRGPDGPELEQLLTLAGRVPDHGRLFPWRFVVIEGAARARAGDVIAAAYCSDNPQADAESIAFERNRLARAPVVVAVVSKAAPHAKIPEWEQVMSAGAVCMNLLIAARAMGFAGCWLTEWYAYDRRVMDVLGLAPNERIAGFVHLGMSDTVPRERDRPDIAAITTRF